MKQPRLVGLLCILLVLLALRAGQTMSDAAEIDVAMPTRGAPSTVTAWAQELPSLPVTTGALRRARGLDDGEPRNAFAVRPLPVPPAPPAPQVQLVVKASNAPALPSSPVPEPALAPPLRVIGTWSDGHGDSVFIAGPRATYHGRVGDVLMAEYRVTAIARHQVTLMHIASNRDVVLAVPTTTNTTHLR